MRLGIGRVRRLRRRGLITRRQAKKLVNALLGVEGERRRGRPLLRSNVDVWDEQQALMLNGEITETDAYLMLKRRFLWGPAFGLIGVLEILSPGGRGFDWLRVAELAGMGVLLGFVVVAIGCGVSILRLRKTAGWLRALEDGP